MLRKFARPASLVVLMAVAGCNAAGPPSAPAPVTQTSAPAGDYGARVGRLVINGKDVTVNVDTKSDASLMRPIAYGAYVRDPATPASRAAFVGTGTSDSDMIRPVRFSPDADYPEMLSGYLAHIDPGGQTTMIEFYEDGSGCETDIVTRRGKDGTVRTYFVNSTGWIDNMLDEMGKKPVRNCTR